MRLLPYTIPIHLSELILASLLKLLSNNDVEASVRSHAFFFERVCLFVPSKVHSPLSRNDFPAVTLVLPIFKLLLHITALDQRQPQKNRRHTNCTERVSLVNISSRYRSTDKPARVDRCEYRMLKVSRPCCFVGVSLPRTSTLYQFLSGVTIR